MKTNRDIRRDLLQAYMKKHKIAAHPMAARLGIHGYSLLRYLKGGDLASRNEAKIEEFLVQWGLWDAAETPDGRLLLKGSQDVE